jgi:hypothetical protein
MKRTKYVITQWFPGKRKSKSLWQAEFETLEDARIWLREKKEDHPSIADYLLLLED